MQNLPWTFVVTLFVLLWQYGRIMGNWCAGKLEYFYVIIIVTIWNAQLCEHWSCGRNISDWHRLS